MNRLFASFKGLRGIENLPSEARKKLDEHIRMKAVDLAEEKMILSDKPQENYTEDQIQQFWKERKSTRWDREKTEADRLADEATDPPPGSPQARRKAL